MTTDAFGRRVDPEDPDPIAALIKVVNAEADDNMKVRRGVVVFGRTMGRVIWGLIGVFLAVVVAGAVGYSLIAAQANRNTLGLRVGCVLLTNAVIQAGVGGQRNDTPAGRAQAELTRLVYIGIGRSWTPTERARAASLQAVIAAAGGIIKTPNCDEVARHPERYRTLLVLETDGTPQGKQAEPVHPNP